MIGWCILGNCKITGEAEIKVIDIRPVRSALASSSDLAPYNDFGLVISERCYKN